MKKKLTAAVAFLILLYLVLFPKESLEASTLGLKLWFDTMLPTLLPFMFLANLIVELNLIDSLIGLFYPVLGPLFGIGKKGCFVLLLGFVCGYPMGAKICGDLVSRGELSPQEGQYLLGFCNNASPAYMLGYVLYTSLHRESRLLPLLLCIYVPPLCYGLLSRRLLYGKISGKSPGVRPKAVAACSVPQSAGKNLGDGAARGQNKGGYVFPGLSVAAVECSMMNAFLNMTKLGGYMILFSILASMCAVLPGVTESVKNIVMMLLEITNGTAAMAASGLPEGLKIMLILTGNAFGGLSCLAQTKSMIQGSGLSSARYVRDKLAVAAICAVMTGIFCL